MSPRSDVQVDRDGNPRYGAADNDIVLYAERLNREAQWLRMQAQEVDEEADRVRGLVRDWRYGSEKQPARRLEAYRKKVLFHEKRRKH